MRLWKPSDIYGPLDIRPRRFTEYRKRGLINPDVEPRNTSPSKFNAFDVLRAAMVDMGERQGMTLEAAARIPEMALTTGTIMSLVPPMPGLSQGDAYLVLVRGKAVEVLIGSDVRQMDTALAQVGGTKIVADKNIKFVIFDDVCLHVDRVALAGYDASSDAIAFINLTAFARRVVKSVGIDPLDNIYEPLNLRRPFFDKLGKLPVAAAVECYELLRTVVAGKLPWMLAKLAMEKRGLDVSDLKGVFVKEN